MNHYMGDVIMAKEKFHTRLNFDGGKNKGATRDKIEKVCIVCNKSYFGVRQSRTCSEKYCMGYAKREYQKRNLASILEKRKQNNPDRREYTIQDHPSEVKIKGICNTCGDKFNPESSWDAVCSKCKRLANHIKPKPKQLKFDVSAVITEHLGENIGLMQIIENMYQGYKPLEHQTIFSAVYEELLKRFGEKYFMED